MGYLENRHILKLKDETKYHKALFSPINNTFIYSVWENPGKIVLMDLDSKKTSWTKYIEGKYIINISFSKTGEEIYIATADFYIYTLKASDGSIINTYKLNTYSSLYEPYTFSDNGEFLACLDNIYAFGENTSDITIYKTKNGEEINSFSVRYKYINNLKFSSENNFLLASFCNSDILKYNLKTNTDFIYKSDSLRTYCASDTLDYEKKIFLNNILW